MSKSRWRFAAGGLLLPLALGSGATRAQAYPSGPLRIVVPFQAGGSTDMVARTLAQKLKDRFNQPVVVENRAGANGTIGAALVAKSPPDGHTMLLVQSGFVSNPILMRNLPYDQARDLAPVSSSRPDRWCWSCIRRCRRNRQGADRICQAAPGRAQLRFARQRLALGPLRGAVRCDGGRQDDPRSLQGVRRCPRRRAGRARAGVLHEPGACAALPEGREAACVGRDDSRALGGRAGPAHDRRGGLAGL